MTTYKNLLALLFLKIKSGNRNNFYLAWVLFFLIKNSGGLDQVAKGSHTQHISSNYVNKIEPSSDIYKTK